MVNKASPHCMCIITITNMGSILKMLPGRLHRSIFKAHLNWPLTTLIAVVFCVHIRVPFEQTNGQNMSFYIMLTHHSMTFEMCGKEQGNSPSVELGDYWLCTLMQLFFSDDGVETYTCFQWTGEGGRICPRQHCRSPETWTGSLKWKVQKRVSSHVTAAPSCLKTTFRRV